MAFFSLAKINSGEDHHGEGRVRETLFEAEECACARRGEGGVADPTLKNTREVQEMATPLASPDSQVSDLDIAKIARKMNNWRTLSPYLGLIEQQETEIQRSCNDYLEEKSAALKKWREIKGRGATYQALIVAVKEAGDVNLADYVQTLTTGQAATENVQPRVQQDGRAASSEAELSKLAYYTASGVLRTEDILLYKQYACLDIVRHIASKIVHEF